jgi:hypothetical protein
MTHDDTGQDLSELFAAEDAAFQSAAFVETVMAPIQRHTAQRRMVLGGAALLGGTVAGAQLPGVVSRLSNVSVNSNAAALDFGTAFSALQSLNPLWIASVLIIAGCCAAVTIFERA